MNNHYFKEARRIWDEELRNKIDQDLFDRIESRLNDIYIAKLVVAWHDIGWALDGKRIIEALIRRELK